MGGGWGGMGWGGVGWDDNVHVPMHTQAQQPHHLLAVEKRQAQLFHDQLPVGWGELIRFMFLCLHTHSNLIICLAVEHLHALLFHDQLPVGWGELIRFMFLCLHTHSNLIIFLAVEHLHALLFHDQLQNCPTQNLKIFLHPYS